MTTPAAADVRALLVGVSNYDVAEDVIPDLRGPANDVRLMRSVLETRGAEDIVVIADGVDGAERPTLAAIEKGFADITARAEAGDLVYIHLSGHGTRQHDENGDETDGLDEVFLPADVSKAGNGKTIPNALVDDRIGELVDAIRAKGATVWLVMDSCHSGSGMRNLSEAIATRHVDPDKLSISTRAAPASNSATPEPETDQDGFGSYLAFYATRSNDVAREADLSLGDGESAWYGLFTAAIAARLEAGQPLTYRQLFQGVLSDMTGGNRLGAAGIQTPLWEGDLIDRPVFGSDVTSTVPRYLTSRRSVEAGLVHGLRKGSLLALVEDITDAPDQVLGFAQIEKAEARRSRMRPVDASCVPKAEELCPKAGALPKSARFVQLELHPIDQFIRFAPAVNAEDGAPLAAHHPVMLALEGAVALASQQTGIPSELNATTYQVAAVLRGNNLWFGPVATIGDEPTGLKVELSAQPSPADLAPYVQRILKAEQIAQTFSLLDSGTSFSKRQPVEISGGLLTSDLSDLAPPDTSDEDIRPFLECGPNFNASLDGGFASLDRSVDVKQCDMLRFEATGKRDKQIDINRIHIDAKYCVWVDEKSTEGPDSRVVLGDDIVVCSDCPDQNPEQDVEDIPGDVYTAGHERLFILMAELEENTEQLKLKNALENCLANGANRSVQANALSSMLNQVATTGNTRGNMSMSFKGTQSAIWVESFRWRVLPRKEAFGDLSLSE